MFLLPHIQGMPGLPAQVTSTGMGHAKILELRILEDPFIIRIFGILA